MASELVADHVPTQVFVDSVAAPGESDASLDGEALGAAFYFSHLPLTYQQLLAGHQGPYLRAAAATAVGEMLRGDWVGTLGVDAVAGPLPSENLK